MGFSRQEYWSGLPFPSPVIGIYICSIYVLKLAQAGPGLWAEGPCFHQGPIRAAGTIYREILFKNKIQKQAELS